MAILSCACAAGGLSRWLWQLPALFGFRLWSNARFILWLN